MAMVAEALGLTVPNSAMVPGVYSERLAIAKRAGEIVLHILQRGGPLPRDLVTRRALENASAIVAATGGSTNAALHIPAIANEAGIRFTVDDVAAVFARTPLIGDLRPGGQYLAKDVHDRGGVSVIIRALIDTGADRTAIHPNVLASIDSPPAGTIRLRRPGSTSTFRRVNLHDVRLAFAGASALAGRAVVAVHRPRVTAV